MRGIKSFLPATLLTSILLTPATLCALEENNVTQKPDDISSLNFAAPSSAQGQLAESHQLKKARYLSTEFKSGFESWETWKKEIKEESYFDFAGHYASMYQHISNTIEGANSDGSAGVLRLTGSWTIVGRDTPNSGALVATVDHRHAYQNTTPAELASNAGYLGLTGTFFSDIGTALIYLNYQQTLNDGNTGFVIGRMDPNDYQGVLGYVNPWVTFTNIAILLDATVSFPDSSWGVGVGTWLNDQWYVLGGINDANGLATDNLEFLDGGSEFYTYAHVGWSPSKAERYTANVHIMAWHVDERVDVGLEESQGFAMAANWTFDEKWMPFARLGFSEGSAPIYNRSATAGLMYSFEDSSNQMGVAVNWGSPPNGLEDQTTVEAFWNVYLGKHFAITPDIQYLKNPSLNTESDHAWVYGMRTRFTF